MHKHLSMPSWTRWAAGGVLLAVAIAAGAVSLTLNVFHGLEAGLAAGIAFGLADIGKIIIPVVAGLIGWSFQMRMTAAICVLASLWAAVNYYADHDGRNLLAKQHGASIYADAEKHIVELEAEAARFTALADDEAKRGGCGSSCRHLMAQASDARLRLQRARNSRAELKPVETGGLAAMIAMASGASADGVARGIGAIKAALFLALIEALVWLSVPAMPLLAMAAKSRVMAVAKPRAAIAKLMPSAARGTRSYYLQRLEREHPALADMVHGGELTVHKACIQSGLRKVPKKDWCQHRV